MMKKSMKVENGMSNNNKSKSDKKKISERFKGLFNGYNACITWKILAILTFIIGIIVIILSKNIWVHIATCIALSDFCVGFWIKSI